jgi:hypothetical protein
MTIWRLFFLNGDIKAKMMSPSWNNFFWSLLRFVVVRSGHDEGLGRISSDQSCSFFDGRKKEGKHKKKFLNSVCRNISCRSLGICLQAFAKCLPLRSSILSVIHVWIGDLELFTA